MQNIQTIVSKLNKSQVLNQWHGYLTPTEILQLIELGAGNPDIQEVQKRVIDKKNNGNSQPEHFYFNPKKNSELKKILDKSFPNHTKAHNFL